MPTWAKAFKFLLDMAYAQFRDSCSRTSQFSFWASFHILSEDNQQWSLGQSDDESDENTAQALARPQGTWVAFLLDLPSNTGGITFIYWCSSVSNLHIHIYISCWDINHIMPDQLPIRYFYAVAVITLAVPSRQAKECWNLRQMHAADHRPVRITWYAAQLFTYAVMFCQYYCTLCTYYGITSIMSSSCLAQRRWFPSWINQARITPLKMAFTDHAQPWL